MTISLLTPSAYSKDMGTILKEYGIPCAIALGLGLSLADKSQDGLAIGGSVCGAVSVHNYLTQERELTEAEYANMEKIINQKVDAQLKEKEESLNLRIAEMEKKQAQQLEDMRKILREVMAERIVKMEDELKIEFTKKMESGELLPKLEENLKRLIKREVVVESNSRKKEIIEECVNETIKEVIAKPIGVPQSPLEN